jgi:hypothetical protein
MLYSEGYARAGAGKVPGANLLPGPPRHHNAGTMPPSIKPAYRVRPLGLGDVLDEAFRIYRARFGLMFGTALVAGLPGILFGLGGGGGTLVTAYMQGLGAPGPLSEGYGTPLLFLLAAGAIAAVVMLPVSMAAPHFAASAAALGLPATVGSITRFSFRNYFRLWVLAGVTWFMSALWLLGVTLYFLVRWSFVFETFYLESSGVGGAFNRSSALTLQAWWRTFGIRFLAKLVAGIISTIVGTLFALPALLLPAGSLRQSAAGLLGALVAVVLVPFPALVCTLLYLDRRVRREALDLQLMAGEAGQVTAPPPAPGATPAAPAWGPPSAPGGLPPGWGDNPPSPR